MKKEKLYLSGSAFAIAQECPASLTIKFSGKLMADGKDAAAGTDEHEKIADDIESVRRFLPEKHETMQEHVEPSRLEVEYKDFRLSGKPDYYAIDDKTKTLHVVDWKTGPMGVGHLSASQLDFYSYLVLRKIKTPFRYSVESELVSPRLNQRKKFTRNPAELSADVESKLDAILKAVKKKEKPQAGDHCRYCNKRFVCVVLREELKRFADPEVFGTDGVRKEKLQKITAEDLKTLAIASAAITDIRKYVSELVEHGAGPAGVRVETQNAARIFAEGVDVHMIADALGQQGPDNITEQKLKTPAQLEKAGFTLDAVQEYIVTTQRKVLKVEVPKKQAQTTVKTKKGK